MQNTLQGNSLLKNLEDYAVLLASGLLSLLTLQNTQVKAIEIGIMKEDQAERSNTIIWDLRRLIKLYHDQTESILEMLPDEFDHNAIIAKLQADEIKKAKTLAKKPRVKKCDT